MCRIEREWMLESRVVPGPISTLICRIVSRVRGFAKKLKKIRVYYGGGLGPGLTDFCFFENRPKIALNQY